METDTEFVCDRCSKCCETHRVPITAFDLQRLEASSEVKGRELREFVELLSPEELDLEGEPESLALVRERTGLLVLRHEDEGCVFLNRGTGCRIHAHRPAACRAYPFDRPESDTDALSLHPHRVCPSDTIQARDPDDAKGESIESFRPAIALRDQEATAHAETLQVWNKRQRLRLHMAKLPQSESQLLSHLRRGKDDTSEPCI